MTNTTKIKVMMYFIFVQYIKHRMHNAKTLRILFDNKLREVYAKTTSQLSVGDSSVCHE